MLLFKAEVRISKLLEVVAVIGDCIFLGCMQLEEEILWILLLLFMLLFFFVKEF